MTLAGWLVMAAALTIGLAACAGSDDNIEQNTPDIPTNPTTPKTYTLTVTAKKGGDATRALGLDTDGMTLNATWAEGDKVTVLNPAKNTSYPDALVAQSVGASTTLSGQLTGAEQPIEEGDELLLVFNRNADLSHAQEGTLGYIANNLDQAIGTLTVKSIDANGNITPEEATTEFVNNNTIVRFTLVDKADPTTHLKPTTLTITDGDKCYTLSELTEDTYTANRYSKSGEEQSGNGVLYACILPANAKNITLTATMDNGDKYAYTKSGVTFVSGQFYSITVQMIKQREVNISTVTASTLPVVDGNPTLTLENGDVLKGTLNDNYKISIAPGATVTLDCVTINGANSDACKWAGITCNGDATIVLSGGNTVKGFYEDYPGIYIAPNKTLTIKGTGSLNASSNNYGAGIGGGYNIDCGNIEIEGGTIVANAGSGATGIGSGDSGACGTITIKGANVEAHGGESGTGIGSSSSGSCGIITISGGTIIATGGKDAAGIGCGYDGTCNDGITINGTANVTATGGFCGAGIGSGHVYSNESHCGDITISGSATVTATGGDNGAGIGSGDSGNYQSTCGNIKISGSATVTATGGNSGAGIGSGRGESSQSTCGNITISGGTVTATGGREGAGIGSGSGGNNYKSSCGDILIEGGTVTASGGSETGAAGIGSGRKGKFTSITITDGITSVEATSGGDNAWPIGKGDGDRSDDVSDSYNPVCAPVIIGGVNINDYYDEEQIFYNGPGRGWQEGDENSSLELKKSDDENTWTLTPKTTE